jgi:hypothetical protein
MSGDPQRLAASDYAQARHAFLRAAERRLAVRTSYPIAARGEAGEELAVDTAYLGPAAPERLIVVSSGIHGIEGFAGSAIQRQLLEAQLDGFALPRDTGLLVVHALNPYGFAWRRRVNESNVDLNRNFLRHPEEHVANPGYDALHDAINPERLDPESEAESRRRLLAYAEQHGFRRLQEVLACGQYAHPRGVQYGGQREEASNRLLRAIAREESRGARSVAWVDLHTGLGPFGEVEPISESPAEAPAFLRLRAWLGDAAKSTAAGDSVSPALRGVMEWALAQELGPDCELTAFAAEFGTYAPDRVFWAMRADNWLHHHGDLDAPQGRAIRAELLEVFRPSDPTWHARVLDGAARVLERTRAGLVRD